MRAAGVLSPIAGVVLASAAAAKLLAPREREIEPDQVKLGDYFSNEEIARGHSYARGQLALGLAGMALESGVLVVVVLRRPRWLPGSRIAPVGGGAADAAVLSLTLSLARMPTGVLARRRAMQVGLSTQSWGSWGVDLLKASAITTTFAAVAGGAVTWISRRYPRSWWIAAAGGSVLVGAVFAGLSPVLLDPLFNDFEPIEKGSVRSDVLDLAAAAGVKVGEVYKVDASRRTSAANAYVTGLGPTKRVVLFDTLLDRYSREEVRVVVAHELAHVRHRDVPRGIAFAALAAPAVAFATQRLGSVLSGEQDMPAALPALALAAGLAGAPVGLVGNRLSRAIERRADAFSLRLSEAPEAFVSFERKIALQNVADLAPPRIVTSVFSTHPPTAERIGMALAYLKKAGAPAPAP